MVAQPNDCGWIDPGTAQAMDEEDPDKAGKLAEAQALADQPPVLDFDRLLLQRSEDREVLLTNTCTVPVKWWLELGDAMDELLAARGD